MDEVTLYVDGACRGNPGQMGVGVVAIARGGVGEFSKACGHGTNNIAELLAVQHGLEQIPLPYDCIRVTLYTDSHYAWKLLTGCYQPKVNKELVARIQKMLALFPRIRILPVPGHSGVTYNERADQLAKTASKNS